MISYYIRTDHKSIIEIANCFGSVSTDVDTFEINKLNLKGSGLEGIETLNCKLVYHGWLTSPSTGLRFGLEIQFDDADTALIFKLGWQSYIVDTLFNI